MITINARKSKKKPLSASEKKAYRKFNGKSYHLYKSGTKKIVDDYIKMYGIPKWASYRIIKVGTEYRLYMRRK